MRGLARLNNIRLARRCVGVANDCSLSWCGSDIKITIVI